MSPTPPLASGPDGRPALRPLLATVLEALHTGAVARGGPLPVGGPGAVAARVRTRLGEPLPQHGTGAEAALRDVVRLVAEGAADPADPLCAAHLHCPPLAVAAAADLAASVLNPSLDSWDQAPAASALEAVLTRAFAAEIYAGRRPGPGAAPGAGNAAPGAGSTALAAARTTADAAPDAASAAVLHAAPDAVVTTGGTEANQLALLLAREWCGPAVRLVCGANAHHSLPRAAWLLGLPAPVTVPAPGGVLDPAALARCLRTLDGSPVLVAATAGTTDAGLIDPLPQIADVCAAAGARLHVDAAYGGALLFSDRLRPLLAGLPRADTVTLDLHKLGWQPAAAGLFAVRDPRDLTVLGHHADYLNAGDDTEAGLPDLLGRSLRTTRRADVLKIAVTLRALGRAGLGRLVEAVCDQAQELAARLAEHPGFTLFGPPVTSTVVFRPTGATDAHVARVRRGLLTEGRAVVGRARIGGRLWLKATLLNPHARSCDLTALVKLVEGHTPQ